MIDSDFLILAVVSFTRELVVNFYCKSTPIHFALVIIITILIGTVTPPVGLQLYIASSIAKLPISKVTIWLFVAIMVAVLLLITYVPSLVTYIPHLVFGT